MSHHIAVMRDHVDRLGHDCAIAADHCGIWILTRFAGCLQKTDAAAHHQAIDYLNVHTPLLIGWHRSVDSSKRHSCTISARVSNCPEYLHEPLGDLPGRIVHTFACLPLNVGGMVQKRGTRLRTRQNQRLLMFPLNQDGRQQAEDDKQN
jgi:hypothetical protein